MNAESWILLAGAIVPVIGGFVWWLVTIEQRMLTREEYERVSKDGRNEMSEKLDKILERIDVALDAKAPKSDLDTKHQENIRRFDEIAGNIQENNRLATNDRHEVRDKLGELSVKIARVEALADRAGMQR